MRTAWLAGVGVGVAVIAAVFVGAAAATTGAPVFYDARYPGVASADADGYEAGEGVDPRAASEGAVDEADTNEEPLRTDDPVTPDQPGAASPTPAPAPTPAPGPGPGSGDRTPGDPGDIPEVTVPPTAEERRAWLAFQQVLRECMAAEGHEYLYWEWWNPGPDTSNRFPAMPADLSGEQVAAWQAALERCSEQASAMRSAVPPIPPADDIGMEVEVDPER